MMTAIPGDWKVNDDEGKALPDEETMKRLEENIPLLRATHPELVPFLQRLQCIINVQADAIMKGSASNRAMVLQCEAHRGERRRFDREIKQLSEDLKAAKDKLAKMAEPLDLLPDIPPAVSDTLEAVSDEVMEAECLEAELPLPAETPAPVAEVPAVLRVNPGLMTPERLIQFRESNERSMMAAKLEPAPCACTPTDEDVARYVAAIAAKHGMEPEELCFTVDKSGNFTVHNQVPVQGRRRSASRPTLDGAVESLRLELHQQM